jgi:hypothetical protein
MTQARVDETIATYVAAWNETDLAMRRQLLERVWAANDSPRRRK